MSESVKIIAKGRVQGVWFRKFTQRKARELNIRGWVRNLPNGDVEAVGVGSEQEMLAFIEALKIGPSAAEVNELLIEFWDGEVGAGFKIIY